MIFRPELAKLVLHHKKTQTRRIALDQSCRYETGKSYAVQPGRGKTAICRITVTEVRRETLGEISIADARREGFRTTREFFAAWKEAHGQVDESLEVWVISFLTGEHADELRYLRSGPPGPVRCTGCQRGLPDGVARCPHCNRSRPSARSDDSGYTSRRNRALVGEDAPALSAIDLERYAKDARRRDELVRKARRADMPLDERIRELVEQARDGSAEAQRALFSIEQRVERVAAGLYRDAS